MHCQLSVVGRIKSWAATLPSRTWACTGMIVSRARSPGRRGRPFAPTWIATCPGATQSRQKTHFVQKNCKLRKHFT